MNSLIEQKRDDLNRLCERFKVQQLELFGSAAQGEFDPATSDLDFLVEFQALQPGEPFDCYFGLREGLEGLFRRSVDLVMSRAIKNPYFLRSVNQTRTLVYAA